MNTDNNLPPEMDTFLTQLDETLLHAQTSSQHMQSSLLLLREQTKAVHETFSVLDNNFKEVEQQAQLELTTLAKRAKE
jgi:hypothetical protein